MVRFAFLGLGLGGIYALAGLGLVVVYRGSGVVNFAQGAFAAVGAYIFYTLHISHGLPTALAVVLALVVSGFVGLLMHVLVMRPLRNAPPLTRVIATLGVMTALQQLGHLILGAQIILVPSFLPTNAVSPVHGAIVSVDRFILLAIAVIVSVALWAFYKFSRFGAVTAAVAESERSAQFNGHSPDVIAAANWVLGAVLAGAAGVLVVPIVGLNIDTLVLLVVPALATCVVANFYSFIGALGASIAIGIVQSEITGHVQATGWSDAVPFLLVILVLVVRGRPLPLRSHVNEVLPEIGTGILKPVPLLVALVGTSLLILLAPSTWSDAATISIITGIICISLVVVVGYAGQLSLAEFAFAGWSAYVAGRLAATHGIPFLLAMVIGMVAAVPVGVLVGLPALRTRGINLAIVTFGLAFSVQSVLFESVPYTGGINGTTLKPASLFGWSIAAANHPQRYALVCLVVLVVAALVAGNIRRGRSGRRLVAVRSNERAAASLGISVYGAKLYAFAVSAAIAGLGGVLLAFQSTYVDYTQFNVFQSIAVVIYTVIGGVGYLIGGLIAGLVAAGGLSSQVVSSFINSGSIIEYVDLVLAVLLVPTLIKFPNGLSAALVKVKVPTSGPFSRVRKTRNLPVDQQNASISIVEERRDDGDSTKSAGVVPKVILKAHRVTPRTLRVQDISVRYGGVHALSGVSLEVNPGEVVGLMGPNGAGKTTLIDAVTGFTSIHSGTIELDGVRIDRVSTRRRSRLGVSRTFQSLELFDQLSVIENLRAASDRRDTSAYFTDLVRPRAGSLTPAASLAVEAFELEGDLERLPTELPYGRRRQVALARAIATEPSVLLLDEPAAGLNEGETRELGSSVRKLADEWGMGVLLVEHDVPMLNKVCDRLVVIDFGSMLAAGTPAEIRVNQRVIAAYLGEEPDDDGDEDLVDSIGNVTSGGN